MNRVMVLILAGVLAGFAANTEMTYEQYGTELASAQQREKTAKEEVAQEQAQIESLKQRLTDITQRIAQTIQEKYTILGITEQDVLAAESEIAAIKQDIGLLMGLAPEELAKRTSDIKKIGDRIAALKQKPVSFLWRIRDQIRDLESDLEKLKSNMTAASATTTTKPQSYTVRENPGKRDCLWRISEYDFIYGDAAQWPKLYQANKTLIKEKYARYVKRTADPKYSRAEDLIYPGQELDVPR
jgi:nucleoid-associated protein YgaU